MILVGFALFCRHRLVLSPEEEYALSGGTHGDPQAEGYDAMEDEVFGDKTKPLRSKGAGSSVRGMRGPARLGRGAAPRSRDAGPSGILRGSDSAGSSTRWGRDAAGTA